MVTTEEVEDEDLYAWGLPPLDLSQPIILSTHNEMNEITDFEGGGKFPTYAIQSDYVTNTFTDYDTTNTTLPMDNTPVQPLPNDTSLPTNTFHSDLYATLGFADRKSHFVQARYHLLYLILQRNTKTRNAFP